MGSMPLRLLEREWIWSRPAIIDSEITLTVNKNYKYVLSEYKISSNNSIKLIGNELIISGIWRLVVGLAGPTRWSSWNLEKLWMARSILCHWSDDCAPTVKHLLQQEKKPVFAPRSPIIHFFISCVFLQYYWSWSLNISTYHIQPGIYIS